MCKIDIHSLIQQRRQRIVASVDQSWVVIRSPETQKAVFKQYVVHKLNYLNSSAQSK